MTSDLQSRVLNLEKERHTQLSAWLSLDQVEPIIIGRLDQILEEKLAARLPRVREAREVPHSCVCPPGRFEPETVALTTVASHGAVRPRESLAWDLCERPNAGRSTASLLERSGAGRPRPVPPGFNLGSGKKHRGPREPGVKAFKACRQRGGSGI
ncbi:hypothetical protein AAFF_G00139910 [Aldrovandia affinis]|uniref:Uncharacterized protein n=1 Tax=Aldrovandia affinis TaxID=143900 RepID=A0AAD7TCT2_9TELE|nr:hypothetical protein AAFF_G00139910 [Aldrovandia affinis]